MKINELKAGASNVEVEATVADKQEPREVITKYGKRLNVANVTLKDDTGTISFSLWGKDIDGVNKGDKIKITNGYVTEFRGTPQLATGKYGKFEIVGKGEAADDEAPDYSAEEPE